MNKVAMCFAAGCLVANFVHAGKPVLELDDLAKWTSAGDVALSNDGAYALYKIQNQPLRNNTLVVQALRGHWSVEVAGVDSNNFTQDSRWIIYRTSDENLCMQRLGAAELKCLPRVKAFSMFFRD